MQTTNTIEEKHSTLVGTWAKWPYCKCEQRFRWVAHKFNKESHNLFIGFKDQKLIIRSCDITIRNILKIKIRFERCYFLTDEKQVIIRFRFISDNVWKNRRNLSRSNHCVSDLLAHMQKMHKDSTEATKV